MGSPAAPLAARRRAASYCLLFAWLGLIFSVVLVAHHAFGWGPSWCELHARVSCDTVLNSPYARFLGVPVSLLGVSYFIIAVGFTVFLAGPRTDDEEIAAAFFLYTLLGCLGCAYFVWAEWTLGALCPLCTVVHVACFATLPLAWRIARTSAPRFSYGPVSVIKLALALPMWVLVAVLLFGTPLLAFYLLSLEELSYDPAGLEQLARCLTARNFKLYTLESCMYCKRQGGREREREKHVGLVLTCIRSRCLWQRCLPAPGNRHVHARELPVGCDHLPHLGSSGCVR